MQYIDYKNLEGFIEILNYYMEPCVSYKNESYWISWSNDKKQLFFTNNHGTTQQFNNINDFLEKATMNDGKILSQVWDNIDELIA